MKARKMIRICVSTKLSGLNKLSDYEIEHLWATCSLVPRLLCVGGESTKPGNEAIELYHSKNRIVILTINL